MTQEQKIIRVKVGLLELAKQLGNGLRTPLPTLRRHRRGCQRTARGRGGFATPSSWRTCTPYSLPVSRRTQVKFELMHLIALWRYTTAGVVIEGAVMKAAPATT